MKNTTHLGVKRPSIASRLAGPRLTFDLGQSESPGLEVEWSGRKSSGRSALKQFLALKVSMQTAQREKQAQTARIAHTHIRTSVRTSYSEGEEIDLRESDSDGESEMTERSSNRGSESAPQTFINRIQTPIRVQNIPASSQLVENVMRDEEVFFYGTQEEEPAVLESTQILPTRKSENLGSQDIYQLIIEESFTPVHSSTEEAASENEIVTVKKRSTPPDRNILPNRAKPRFLDIEASQSSGASADEEENRISQVSRLFASDSEGHDSEGHSDIRALHAKWEVEAESRALERLFRVGRAERDSLGPVERQKPKEKKMRPKDKVKPLGARKIEKSRTVEKTNIVARRKSRSAPPERIPANIGSPVKRKNRKSSFTSPLAEFVIYKPTPLFQRENVANFAFLFQGSKTSTTSVASKIEPIDLPRKRFAFGGGN